MRFIETKTHAYLDYLVGMILIIAPWVLGFHRGGAETWVPVSFGALVIIYSLLTDYELGASRRIPMRMHLLLDLVGGIVLAVSPWLFNFDEHVSTPHLVLGLFSIGASLFTKTTPSSSEADVSAAHRTATNL